MQMTLEDYHTITIGEFFNKLAGYYEVLQKAEKAEWERVSYLSYSILMNNPYVKSIHKPKSFDAFMKKSTQPAPKIINADQLKEFVVFKE